MYFKPGTKHLISAYLLGVLGSTSIPLHFGLSLCDLLVQIRLPYSKWKRTSLAFIWGMKVWCATRGCTVTVPIQFVTSTPSYGPFPRCQKQNTEKWKSRFLSKTNYCGECAAHSCLRRETLSILLDGCQNRLHITLWMFRASACGKR